MPITGFTVGCTAVGSMELYRRAISDAAKDYGIMLPDLLLSEFAACMKAERSLLDKFAASKSTERDLPASYDRLDDLLQEFEHEDDAGSGSVDKAPLYLEGGQREAPKRRKMTTQAVSNIALHNLRRIIVTEATWEDEFYDHCGEEGLPSAKHRTQENLKTALATIEDTGNGKIPAWLYHNLESVRNVLHNALAYLNRETTPPEPSKEELDRIQAAFSKLF